MNKIMTYIRAFFSLGWLGLIIGLMALAMLVAAFSQSSVPFDAAIERMFVLGELESSVALDLAEKQVQESLEFFSLSYGLPSSGAAEKALQAEERISETMARLEEEESFRGDEEFYISDLASEVDEFNQFRAAHRDDFEYVVEFIDELEDEDALDAVYALEENNESLTFMLRSIIIGVEQDRQRALSDFPEDANGSLLMIVIALAAMLFLALLGYQAIALAVRPLSHLRNTITSIGGDVHRSGQPLAGGVAGNLARALEELAIAEQSRNQAAKQEIEDLRQALYESRRRRLKITQPGRKAE
ncbi:MAG: hypothetical protein R6W69_09985 [Anaerolineales bacterium]